MIVKPSEVHYDEIRDALVLSPSRYSRCEINAPRTPKLSEVLDRGTPFVKGKEPGQKNYVALSTLAFIRTNCVSESRYRPDSQNVIYVHPRKFSSIALTEDDILLLKDGAVGESAILDHDFLASANRNYLVSSGIVKLNVDRSIVDPYYLLAVLKTPVFREQLHILTGAGTTIAHAGKRFLDCKIPFPSQQHDQDLISAICRAIVRKESLIETKWKQVMNTFEKELSLPVSTQEMPTLKDLRGKLRLDASTYSSRLRHYLYEMQSYSGGTATLKEMGFKTRRGPNLAVRDSGRAVYLKKRLNPNYWVVIKPVSLSSFGTIDTFEFMGNRQPKWSFHRGSILFSAEGTVGKTYVFCEDILNATTNFHGIMIGHDNLTESIVLGCFLGHLRERGVLDKMSVGGQGGSLALAHWRELRIPRFRNALKATVQNLYCSTPSDPLPADCTGLIEFHTNRSDSYGIFQLDFQSRYLKTVLEELILRISAGRAVCEDRVLRAMQTLTLQGSFDPFSCT